MKFQEKKPKIFDKNRLFNYGIWLLSKREYTEQEISTKMKKYQPEIDIIQDVILKLKTLNYIDDQRTCQHIINSYSKKESSYKLKQRLSNKGISKDLIEELTSSSIDKSQEFEIAFDLLVKKFKIFDENKKQKYFSFLSQKGYSWDNISKATKKFKELISD